MFFQVSVETNMLVIIRLCFEQDWILCRRLGLGETKEKYNVASISFYEK